MTDDFNEPTRICAPPTRATLVYVWPELFHGQPDPEHITEPSPEEVAEIVGADCRVTAEFPALEDLP